MLIATWYQFIILLYKFAEKYSIDVIYILFSAKISIVKIHYHIAANLKTVAHFVLPLRDVGKQYCLSQIMLFFCVRQNPPSKYCCTSVHLHVTTIVLQWDRKRKKRLINIQNLGHFGKLSQNICVCLLQTRANFSYWIKYTKFHA